MSDDFGQTIQGLHTDGSAKAALDQNVPIMGVDGSGNYQDLSLDTSGQVELAHDVNTNAIFSTITDGTDDLAIYNAGDVALTGAGVMGKDSSGNMQFLKVGTDGELVINVGAADSGHTYGSANLVKDTATPVVSETPSATTKYNGIHVSGFGLCEWSVKFGVTASEAVILVAQTTPSKPSHYIAFPTPLEVLSTETVIVEGTNRENGASPASDFTGHATLFKEA